MGRGTCRTRGRNSVIEAAASSALGVPYGLCMPDDSADHISGVVRLRDVASEDLPALYQFQLDPESNQMAVTNARDLDAFDATWAEILSDRSIVAKAVLVDGMLVGSITCFKMDGLDAIGYWIAREHWGRGIATRALDLILREVSTRPLHARVAKTNVGSIRVLERCGFAITGRRMAPADDRFPACEELLLTLV